MMTDPRLLEPRALEVLLIVDLPERPNWREGWQMLLAHIEAQAEKIEELEAEAAQRRLEL